MLPRLGNAVPDAIIAKGIAGLAQLKFAATSTAFIHELSTLAGTGMGTHFSAGRKCWRRGTRAPARLAKLKADYEATIATLRAGMTASRHQRRIGTLSRASFGVAIIVSHDLHQLSCYVCRWSAKTRRFFNDDLPAAREIRHCESVT